MAVKIPFNRPYLTGKELDAIADCHSRGQLAGDGYYTKECEKILESLTGAARILLTHSCTAALEMAALLIGIKPGEEVIMPSFTFVSTANAFVLRGATPVFVDIRKDTLNLDEKLLEGAITCKTKAIVPVHYAGVGCGMDDILDIAKGRGIPVIEDAAQGIQAKVDGGALGSLGDLGTLSFHETKNVISGEGGALLVNNPDFVERAEHIREKGTNRASFFRGQVDKYTWVDLGSSYIPGEIIAAFLHSQLQHASLITNQRLELWSKYHEALEPLEKDGWIRRPHIPGNCVHNAHMYYILLETPKVRNRLMASLQAQGIQAIFHYIPLHSSPAGKKYTRAHGSLGNTDDISQRILRLPLWIGMPDPGVIVEKINQILKTL